MYRLIVMGRKVHLFFMATYKLSDPRTGGGSSPRGLPGVSDVKERLYEKKNDMKCNAVIHLCELRILTIGAKLVVQNWLEN